MIEEESKTERKLTGQVRVAKVYLEMIKGEGAVNLTALKKAIYVMVMHAYS